MTSLRIVLAGLLVCTTSQAVFAELAAQPFLAPPRLVEKGAPGTLKATESTLAKTDCNPQGDITRDGQTVELNLQVQKRENYIYNPGNPDGAKDKVKLRSYGGCLSGPLIDVQPGNTLRVHLDNQLDKNDPSCPGGGDPANGQPGCFNTINLHYHGMHVSPSGNSDNVLLNIAPQTQFEYEINIPTDHPSGTFWYHAHRHGSTALQVASGAAGALIVRGDRPYTGGKPGDIDTILKNAAGHPITEQVFLFQQIPYACFDDKGGIIKQKDDTWTCPSGKTGVVENFHTQLSSATVWDESGRFTSINGVVQPTLQGIAAGEIQRWRFIHAGIHDTVNLQIVPMNPTSPKATLALKGVLSGTPKEQAAVIADLCPATVPGTSKPVELVPQFEIAADGLTRTAIRPIGVNKKSVSGGIGSNFLQPGYRSDVLLMFPRDGTYCVLNQAATPAERANADPKGGPGGQGPNETQLLATVIVSGGQVVTDDPQSYIQQALYDANKMDKSLPAAALEGLRTGDLNPWRGMDDLKNAVVNDDIQKADFFIGNPPFPPSPPANAPQKPGDPWTGPFGFYINYKSYDPDRIDFTRQVNTTDDWVLTSQGEPHIFHIHVNPFQVMDVLYAKPGEKPKSIFGPNGECLVPADELGLQNQYCGMWHEFKDTIFVQNDYQVLVRTHYDRYIGEFVIHCHILDHEDGGMMTNIQIVPDITAIGGGIGMAGMKHTAHQHSDSK
ncbi:multicopper oxidase domain-containing protein [Pseudomonas sp. St316]|uniref:multicopper oxidase family protein n=1 Tax=Pseudomonas sp. St316 TaxID=2678257 RepID=UPI001BB31A73|nr:multicopper oxidase domain-containing protein [Pseudomonas sp. St316]BBP60000.1 L-ascorbate oxidase [Pseudomonas sp. St316]